MFTWPILVLLLILGIPMTVLTLINLKLASIKAGVQALLERVNEINKGQLARLKEIDDGRLTRIENRLEYLIHLIEAPTLPVPGPLAYTLLREEDSMLVYKAAFPAAPSPIGDVTSQTFTVTVDGAPVVTKEYGMEATESDEFSVEQGVAVTLSLHYTDDAGNVSDSATQTFTSKDTIKPNAPGEFGAITLVREE